LDPQASGLKPRACLPPKVSSLTPHATNKYDKDLVRKLNAAARDGKYTEKMWPDLTGHSLDDLDAGWRAELEAGGRR
jgi:hypothetical protein